MIRIAAGVAVVFVALLIVVMLRANHEHPAPIAAAPPVVFADRAENETAARVLAAVARLDDGAMRRQRESAIEYLRREVASSSAAAEPPPSELAVFLKKHAAEMQAIRAQLASNPPPVWKLRTEDLENTSQPDLIAIMHLFSMFAADAMASHSAQRDAVAWADLGAMWVLSRSLWSRPDIESVLTALTGSRMIGGVAVKLSPPAPQWWLDFVSFDPRQAFAPALVHEADRVRKYAEQYPIGPPDDDPNGPATAIRRVIEPFVRPVRVVQADESARHLRELAVTIPRSGPCDALPPAARKWTSTLHRLSRFLIEREGAAKLLAVEEQRRRASTWPASIDGRSACAAARWNYRRTASGIELTFTGQLPVPETRIVPPLAYRR